MSNPEFSNINADKGSLSPARTEHDSAGVTQLLKADQNAIQQLLDSLHSVVKYDIELPRIVACGGQSSGRSSVLEAISRIEFPRGNGLCTAFATELMLSRGSTRRLEYKIRWDSPDNKDECNEWIPIKMEELGKTISDAKKAMGSRNRGGDCSFFRDVLQIRAVDPSLPNLTLIDLPSLVQVKENDIKTAKDIVNHYMSQEKTLILAVVAADREYNDQHILEMVNTKFGRNASRVMGVITKPDRIETPEQINFWTSFARNQVVDYQFGLGWHVVKNRGVTESSISFQERDENEKAYFRDNSWNGLEAEQVGIDNLRLKLSKIFDQHTRDSLPDVVGKLYEKSKQCKARLELLRGPGRNLDEKQHYLAQIANRFENLIREAVGDVGAYYDKFFSDDALRLRSVVKSQNDTFVEWMYGWGHTCEVKDSPQRREIEAPVVELEGNFQQLADPSIISGEEFLAMVKAVQSKNLCNEFPGTFNSATINILFREQSKRWRHIARAHISQVWDAAFNVLKIAAQEAAGNEYTADALINCIIVPEMDTKWNALSDKLDEVLRPYEKYHALRHDPEFFMKKYKLQVKTKTDDYQDLFKLSGYIETKFNQTEEDFIHKCIDDELIHKPEFVSSSREILDLMQLYYEVINLWLAPYGRRVFGTS
jgi:Dynamin family/Dynamin central region